MKKLLKKLYWICVLVCILLVTFCGSSSAEGTLGFFALAILIIVPIVSKLKMGKKSQESADRWLKNRRVEIHADQIDYQTNMEIYRNMMKEVESLKRKANSTGGYERNQLLKQADRLERDAQKYYRSLI